MRYPSLTNQTEADGMFINFYPMLVYPSVLCNQEFVLNKNPVAEEAHLKLAGAGGTWDG